MVASDRHVELNELEMVMGAMVGVLRVAAAIVRRRRDRVTGLDDDGRIWTRGIEGALGELAAAKILNEFWSGASSADRRATKARGGDVGELQIRLRIANYENQRKRLVIQQQDDPAENFVLIVGCAPVYRMAGWINAGEAKRHAEWIEPHVTGHGEAWWVPQASLHRIEDLQRAA